MGVFFNGRLITTPAVASVVDDSAMFNRNPAIGNIVAILGKSIGGEPKVPLRFGSPGDAAATLRGGELLDAVSRAFAGTVGTPGPSEVVVLRIDPALRATLTLNDSASAPVIDLTSAVWGRLANRVQVTIETGTTKGKRITTKLDAAVQTQDNIGRQVIKLRYSGAQASATFTVTNTTLTLYAPAGSSVAALDLATFQTVRDLVDRINLVSGFAAQSWDGSEEQPTLASLDAVAAVDCKTADTYITADLQAVVDWFNSQGEPLVVATKRANAAKPPANIAATFLSGGTDGSATTTDWSAAFTAL